MPLPAGLSVRYTRRATAAASRRVAHLPGRSAWLAPAAPFTTVAPMPRTARLAVLAEPRDGDEAAVARYEALLAERARKRWRAKS